MGITEDSQRREARVERSREIVRRSLGYGLGGLIFVALAVLGYRFHALAMHLVEAAIALACLCIFMFGLGFVFEVFPNLPENTKTTLFLIAFYLLILFIAAYFGGRL